MKVIFIITVFVYIIGIAWCSYCLSTKKGRSDNCFKFIKKYNCFGDRVDEDPRIYYNEV